MYVQGPAAASQVLHECCNPGQDEEQQTIKSGARSPLSLTFSPRTIYQLLRFLQTMNVARGKLDSDRNKRQLRMASQLSNMTMRHVLKPRLRRRRRESGRRRRALPRSRRARTTSAKRNARTEPLMGRTTTSHGTCTQRRHHCLVSWRTARSARNDSQSQRIVKQVQMADSFALSVPRSRKIRRRKMRSQRSRL